MPSSRLSEDRKRVIVTTPSEWCEVGHELRVVADATSFGVPPADWLKRLLAHRAADREGFSVLAEDALVEALRNRSIHPALIEEARRAA